VGLSLGGKENGKGKEKRVEVEKKTRKTYSFRNRGKREARPEGH